MIIRLIAALMMLTPAVKLCSQNLLPNGFGEMADNTNFPSLGFDGTDFAAGHGSFVSNSPKTVFSSHHVTYEEGASYFFDFHAKVEDYIPGNQMYAFVSCSDIDGRIIEAPHIMFIAGSTTTLSQDLNPGDEFVYVADLSGFSDQSLYYRRALSFWNWKNSLGYQYPPESYTRNLERASGGLWEQGVGLDFAANRIRLKAPWTGQSYPAGTALSQSNSGGTYPYTKTRFELTEQWVKHETYLSNDQIRPGTAFLRVGWLVDYSQSGVTTKISGVSLRLANAGTNLVHSPDGNVGIGIAEPENKLDVAGTIRAKEIVVEASNWPDYVFEDDYQLRDLEDMRSFISMHGHLPGVPSAAQVEKQGVSVGETQRILLEKIEELTLYLLEKDRRIESLEKENMELAGQLDVRSKDLSSRISELERLFNSNAKNER